MDIRETNLVMRWKKDNLRIFTLKKCFRQLLFLEIVFVTKIKTNCLDVCV